MAQSLKLTQSLSDQPFLDLDEAYATQSRDILGVVIKGGGFRFAGILRNKPNFQLSAEYDRLINADATFSLLNKAGSFAGIAVGVSDFWTQQYYKGGSYLKIQVDVRILDEQGTNLPLRSAQKALAMVSPQSLFKKGSVGSQVDVNANLNSSIDSEQSSPKPISLRPKLVDSQLVTGDTTTTIGPIIKKDATSEAIEEISVNSLIGKGKSLIASTISYAPPVFSIRMKNIGTFQDMLITSADVQLSHESTAVGPLYCDISFAFESRQIKSGSTISNYFKTR